VGVLVQVDSGERRKLGGLLAKIERQIYNLIVSRTVLAALRSIFAGMLIGISLFAQDPKQPAPPAAPQEQEPPEEDQSLKPEVFDFNPLQATKEIDVGNQYLKKGSYNAAANRYQRATKFDPGSSEAFMKLGEAQEKLHLFAEARAAYTKYFELVKDAKDTKEVEAIKKRMAKWPPPAPLSSGKP
jgi:tetratricopeptide (TPR) repeat protein